MQKAILVLSILAVALLAFDGTSSALAAGPQNGGPGDGTGTGEPVDRNITLDGLLADLIHQNLAIAFGISPTDLVARLDSGETIVDIGLSLEFDLETISAIMAQARMDALNEAVSLGLITQEQADWLASRGNRLPGTNFIDGICDGTSDGSSQSMQKVNRRSGFKR